MTSRSAQRKPIAKKTVSKTAKNIAKNVGAEIRSQIQTGKLPEWNLADLYSGIDAPEVARDLRQDGCRLRRV